MRNLIIALALCLGMPAVSVPVMAADAATKEQKQNRKDAEKEAKKKAKELKKEGWKIQGSLGAETALEKHLLKREDFGGTGKEVIGRSYGKTLIRNAADQARFSGSKEFAAEQRMVIQGRIVDEIIDMSGEEIENFLSAFEGKCAAEIKGELRSSFELIRTKDGKYDVEVWFLVDSDKAHTAAIKALQRAAEEQEISLEIARRISEWINED